MAWASMRRVTRARNWSGPERKAAEAASALSSTAWPAGQWSREAWMRAVSGWASSAVESLTVRRAVSEVQDGGMTGSVTVRVSWAWAVRTARAIAPQRRRDAEKTGKNLDLGFLCVSASRR